MARPPRLPPAAVFIWLLGILPSSGLRAPTPSEVPGAAVAGEDKDVSVASAEAAAVVEPQAPIDESPEDKEVLAAEAAAVVGAEASVARAEAHQPSAPHGQRQSRRSRPPRIEILRTSEGGVTPDEEMNSTDVPMLQVGEVVAVYWSHGAAQEPRKAAICVDEKLQQGSVGTVFKASLFGPMADVDIGAIALAHCRGEGDPTIPGRTMAVKQAKNRSDANLIKQAYFMRILWSPEYPHFVRYYGKIDEARLLLMEHASQDYLDFLNDISTSTGLSVNFGIAEAYHFMMDLLRALVRMHALGIAHRDIKLDNLLVQCLPSPCRLLISDYDLTCNVGESRRMPFPCKGRAGTPGYLPPEVYRLSFNAQTMAFAQDVYAAGTVLLKTLQSLKPRTDPGLKHMARQLTAADWFERCSAKECLRQFENEAVARGIALARRPMIRSAPDLPMGAA